MVAGLYFLPHHSDQMWARSQIPLMLSNVFLVNQSDLISPKEAYKLYKVNFLLVILKRRLDIRGDFDVIVSSLSVAGQSSHSWWYDIPVAI